MNFRRQPEQSYMPTEKFEGFDGAMKIIWGTIFEAYIWDKDYFKFNRG